MSNRAARPRRFHRPEPDRYPMIPGTMPIDSDEWRARALAEAHEDLPYVVGTVVHVLVYDRDAGLARIAEVFGDDARRIIADRLDQQGPAAVPIICGRFDARLGAGGTGHVPIVDQRTEAP